MKTYGNQLSWIEYQNQILNGLKMIIGLKSMDAKATKLAKSYFNQGYNIDDAIGGIVAKY